MDANVALERGQPWVRRACPKFLDAAMFGVSSQTSDRGDLLYFNSGSSALSFLVRELGRGGRSPLRVAVQSFNCPSVADAVINGGGEVVLFDIKLPDFSIGLEALRANVDAIDAVVLLHYQGLQNTERREIVEFCTDHGIVVIEDLAHCCDVGWQLSGEFGIFSYAFDKPLSCGRGGALKISEGSSRGQTLRSQHSNLPFEPVDAAAADIAELHRMFLTASQFEYSGRDFSRAGSTLLRSLGIEGSADSPLSRAAVGAVRVVERLARRVGSTAGTRPYGIFRLCESKLSLLELQRKAYFRSRQECRELAAQILESLPLVGLGDDHGAHDWNRVSFLRSRLREDIDFKALRIEAGNFNWPRPLHSLKRFRAGAIEGVSYLNSEVASAQVVNVPAWSHLVLNRIDSSSRKSSTGGWRSV